MKSETPYSHAPRRAFWSRAVSRHFAAGDLVAPDTVLVRPGERVMSAGSCFAANMVPYLESAGIDYVRTERQNPLLAVEPEALGYANFSAAYGNLYTARQLLQLLRRATGRFTPAEAVWDDDGAFVDPFRPGLRYKARSLPEFEALTAQHLSRVRHAFEEANVLVFTLGLTEAWVSTHDGAVFPACPGTVAGKFDPARHAFHNFTVAEIAADLDAFVDEVRALNPALRLILTVSPVPLVATAEAQHVLEATIYSKSVLRAAAGEVTRRHETVTYFPSYEIVTGPQAPADFFEKDRRNVSRAGVDAVMATFLAVCGRDGAAVSVAETEVPKEAALSHMIATAECEEEMADPLAVRYRQAKASRAAATGEGGSLVRRAWRRLGDAYANARK